MSQDKFLSSYNNLNEQQKKAVDTTEGVVIINAGPGTGKTTVLSLRIANILKQTDVSPKNILCLTYTDAAAKNMLEKLSTLIGTTAYKVTINTFHSFCGEIINSFPEFFFQGHKFNPIDTLKQYQLLEEILKTLPFSNKYSSYHPVKGFTYLSTIKSIIENLKKEGLTSQDYLRLINLNQKYLSRINDKIVKIFTESDKFDSRNKNWVEKLAFLSDKLSYVFFEDKLQIDDYLEVFKSNQSKAKYLFLNHNLADNYFYLLENSVKQCIEKNTTTPFSEFKKQILVSVNNNSNNTKTFSLKEFENFESLIDLGNIYKSYSESMYNNGYYDFSDMLLEVLKVLDNNENQTVKNYLQEQYQYILVDEFQDTNGSQLQIIQHLIWNPVFEDNPNLLIVGDTDQTIFKFQGANTGNLENFQKRFAKSCTINLFQNYRSNQEILDFAQNLIEQSEMRDNSSKSKLKSAVR